MRFNSHQHVDINYQSKLFIKQRSEKTNKTTKQEVINNIVILQKEITPNPTSTSTLPDLIIKSTEEKERIDKLQEFVKTSMLRSVDYGSINGFSKLTLLKPGAEKLCDAFGFPKTVDVI